VDALVEELAPLPQHKVHKFIQAGMQEDRAGLRNAPQSLRDFFIDAPQPGPDWLDLDAFAPGIRAFQRNSVAILSAFVTGVMASGGSGRTIGISWRYSGLVVWKDRATDGNSRFASGLCMARSGGC